MAANQVLIKLRSGISTAAFKAESPGIAVKTVSQSSRILLVHSNSLNVAGLMAAYSANPSVAYVQPNYILHVANTPNDPGLSNLWAMNNTAHPG